MKFKDYCSGNFVKFAEKSMTEFSVKEVAVCRVVRNITKVLKYSV